MKYKRANGAISSFFILSVLSIFAILSLLLVMIGANAYKKIVKDTDENNKIRASLTYVANKVRQNDELGAIAVQKIDEINALTIDTVYSDKPYRTYIYFYDDGIYESFLNKETQFKPDQGTKMVSTENFVIYKDGNSLSLKSSIVGSIPLELKLLLRCS